MRPAVDELEITLIGPGYGECVLVHPGGGNWAMVDSCTNNNTNRPAGIEYLENLGVPLDHAVQLIIATHWHDDHVSGMAEVVEHCPNASFCCASTLGKNEFLAAVKAYETRSMVAGTSGVKEINAVFELLGKTGRPIKYALADRQIFTLETENFRVWTLSPSDRQYDKFLAELTGLIPEIDRTKQRCVPQRPNDLSIAASLQMGSELILLGADLEETGEAGTGWSAIVNSKNRPRGLATIFKVAHHGAASAHHQTVWTSLLIEEPFAILTPWNRATKLPTRKDVQRICGLTSLAYSTATFRRRSIKRRPRPVEKTIKNVAKYFGSAEPQTGAVRLRNKKPNDPEGWTVEFFQDACYLSNIH